MSCDFASQLSYFGRGIFYCILAQEFLYLPLMRRLEGRDVCRSVILDPGKKHKRTREVAITPLTQKAQTGAKTWKRRQQRAATPGCMSGVLSSML